MQKQMGKKGKTILLQISKDKSDLSTMQCILTQSHMLQILTLWSITRIIQFLYISAGQLSHTFSEMPSPNQPAFHSFPLDPGIEN
jgi:hypothetical protein